MAAKILDLCRVAQMARDESCRPTSYPKGQDRIAKVGKVNSKSNADEASGDYFSIKNVTLIK
jgi:hypothetical protein